MAYGDDGQDQKPIGVLEYPDEQEQKPKPKGQPVPVADPNQSIHINSNMYAPADSSAPGTGGLEYPEPKPAPPPSTFSQLTAPRPPEFAAAHSWPVRTLDSAGGAFIGALAAPYHAFADPLSPQEQEDFKGHTRIPGELALERLTGAEGLVHGAKDWADPNTRPSWQGVKSVLPEAVGEGIGGTAGAELGTKAIEKGVGAVKSGVDYFGDEARTTRGTKNIKTGLDTPGGKRGERGASMDRAVKDTQADLAEIERSSPGKSKGAKAYHDLAEKIEERQDQMWKEGHEAIVNKPENATHPIDHKAVYDAAMKEITEEATTASPEEAASAKKWVEGLNKDRNLKSADQLIREINDDLRSTNAPTKYGKLQIRAKQAAVKALRSEVDRVLEKNGEQGVKDVNRRWGALDEVKDRLREQAYNVARKESKQGALPEWAHGYAFLHPAAVGKVMSGGAPIAVGLGIKLGKMLGPATGAKALTKGMRQLGKTGLKADVAPPSAPPRPAPKGLLPAPGETSVPGQLPPPGSAELAHPDQFPNPVQGLPAGRNVQRGPAGQMQRVYTGVPAPGVVGHTAESGPIHEDMPPAPQQASRPVERRQSMNQLRVPPTGVERRAPGVGSFEGFQGASPMRGALVKAIQKTLDDPNATAADKAIARDQLKDMQQHPFEQHGGEDFIKEGRRAVEKTKTKEEATKETERRKGGRNQRFEGKDRRVKPTKFGGDDSSNESKIVVEGLEDDKGKVTPHSQPHDRIKYDPWDKDYPRRINRGKTKRA